jgi:hypothetical protein
MIHRITLFYALAFLLSGCDHPAPNVTVTQAAQSAISPQDFALDTVVGLLKSGVADGPSLEARINDPSTGINNVDVDRDGKVDFVNVVESPTPTGKKMDLVAHPSSGTVPDLDFASIGFDRSGPGVAVQAGYAQSVDPAGRYYYHDSLMADALFASWLFMPSRPYYVSYAPAGYAYRSRVPASTFSQTRTTYQTTTRISPVVAAPRPASFSPPAAPAPRPAAATVAQASQGTTAFRADARAKPAATGFGASSPAPARASSPVSRPSPSRGKSK